MTPRLSVRPSRTHLLFRFSDQLQYNFTVYALRGDGGKVKQQNDKNSELHRRFKMEMQTLYVRPAPKLQTVRRTANRLKFGNVRSHTHKSNKMNVFTP